VGTFDILSPDGHPLFVADLPNERGDGAPHHQYVRNEQELQRFIAARDKPGRALYYTVAHLAEGGWRSKENVVASHWVWTEVDFKDHADITPKEILRRIHASPRRPNLIVFSGHGYHVFWRLAEPVDARPGEAQQRLEEVLKLAGTYLGGDSSVAEAARLMRLPGSHNTRKEGESLLAEIVHVDELSCELDDLLDFFLEARPILPEPVKQKASGGEPEEPNPDGPVDVEAALADMEFESGTGNGVNATVCRVIPSLLRKGEHPSDVLERVVSAVMGMAKRCGLKWSETVEIQATRKRILSAYSNLLLKDYDPATREVPEWLPGEYHARWIEVVETGCRPCFGFNAHGFYVRKPQERAASSNFEAAQGKPASNSTQAGLSGDASADEAQAAGGPEERPRAPSTKRTLVLRPFIPFDPAALPQREWLYGKHYQRRTVSMTAGPGGMGKTSLGMVELVAMVTARNLLGEQPTERLRVWLHNGEDPLDEIHRRLAAICQHYEISQEELRDYLWITSGNEFPLRVAKGYTNLQVDRALVQQISDAIGANQIDLAAFDPFVTMHSVSEGDSGKMDTVVRLFAGIADEHDAAIELNHHVRKPAAGAEADHDVFDIRGVLAITDAVRAARVLNRMNKQDANNAGIDEIARLSHFRVDRAKGNYSPAQAATWRQFVNVELPNGDDVGVVTPWDFPGQGINTPEKVAAERKAEEIFLTLLRKFLARGINVSANSGPTYAPAKFATEREALAAKVSKVALKGAMDRLLDSNRIRTEMHNRERHRLALVVEA
jgi:RecA-family ATPase